MTDTLARARRPGVARAHVVVVPPAGRSWPRPSPLVLGALALALVVGTHLVLSARMRVPIIHPDELGYLENARFLARGGLRSETEYYPGFSLLLVPLWWVTKVPSVVFRGTLVIDALVGGLGAVLTWKLVPRLVPGLSGWRRGMVAALVCGYPPFLLYGNFALAETTFAALFGAVVLLASKALPGGRPGWWAALGAASGTLALIHPRGFAVAVATALLGALVLGWRRSSIAPLGALAAGLGSGLVATRALVTYVKGPASNGFGAYRPDGVLSKSLSLHGLSSLVAELAGQLFYLSVATLGLVPVALLLGVRSLHRVVDGDRRPWVLTQAFATLSFLGVWALSSLFMNLGDRADKLIYGRYNEGVIVPLLIIAVADVIGPGVVGRGRHFDPSRHRGLAARRWLSLGLASVALSGLFVRFGHSRAALRGTLNPVNVLGLAPLLTRMGNRIDVWALTAVAVGAITVLSLVSWRLPAATAVGLAALFAVSTVATEAGYLVPGTRARAGQDTIARGIDAIRQVTGMDLSCIGYEPSPGIDYNYYNDRFLLEGQRFEWLEGPAALARCGTLAISRRADFAQRYPGSRLVTTESYLAQSLWAVPRAGDPTFALLDRGGWLSPPTTTPFATVALPPSALTAPTLSADRHGTLGLTPGGSLPLVVTVRHGPGGAPWPSAAALHASSATFAVRLAVRWYPDARGPAGAGPAGAGPAGAGPAGGGPAGGGPAGASADPNCVLTPGAPVPVACPPSVNISDTLLPGQSAHVGLRLVAADSVGRPLPPGTYLVDIGLLQEGVASFNEPGARPIPVVVSS